MNIKRKEFITFLLEILTGALSLVIADYLFKSLYIESFFYACLASIIISLFSVYLKPFLKYLMLPINILTLGISSLFINVIILKLTSLVLGSKFVLNGWIKGIFIALFISIINALLNNIIVNPVRERR